MVGAIISLLELISTLGVLDEYNGGVEAKLDPVLWNRSEYMGGEATPVPTSKLASKDSFKANVGQLSLPAAATFDLMLKQR